MPFPIPVLEKYGISSKYGFLPEVPPIDRLPDPYYNKWESIVSNLQGLILSKRLRGVVDKLPVLSTVGLVHDSEWRRAYSILCFMAHSYIWSEDVPSDRLPQSISIPLLKVSAYLEVPPVATYAAVCLWNYKSLFFDEGIDNLDNIATHITFTGSTDESWFYLVSVAIEARGAPSITSMLEAIKAARVDDVETVTSCLQKFAEILGELGKLLQTMHDRCDPYIFYHRIRPFLAGSKNMKEAGLANGIIYEDGTGSEEFRQFSGGSNAQSSLIQFFDIVLGIEHLPTGEKIGERAIHSTNNPVPAPNQNFILEMRNYMPGPHRRFLEDTLKVANIRDFVYKNCQDHSLTLAYDACLKMLTDFRSLHLKIVSRYIILKSRETKSVSKKADVKAQSQKLDIASSSSKTQGENSSSKSLKGTGGTTLIPFLKQARDETCYLAANAWARRIMNCVGPQDTREFKSEVNYDDCNPIDLTVGNLAAFWTIEETAGGLCHF